MTRCEDIFTRIYADKAWGDGSGGGSSPEASAPYVEVVDRLIEEMKPKVILDVGCGDGWVASRFNLRDALYIGLETVFPVVLRCREQHRGFGAFLWHDIVADPLPESLLAEKPDLVLVKEVTQHLSAGDILSLFDNLRQFPAVLHCSAMQPGDTPATMRTGGYRPVRLRDFGCETEIVAKWKHGETSYQAELWRPKQ